MKNRKFLLIAGAAIVVAILLFFAAQAGERGVGLYRSNSYIGYYDKPDYTDSRLLLTEEAPGEIRVTHVSKRGWATVEHPELGTVYTNFFDLAPDKVKYPIRADRFYDGNEALPMCGQGLLWAIFILAGLLILTPIANKFIAMALVAAEIAYILIFFLFGLPDDLLLGGAFDFGVGTAIGFLTNMIGLIVLALSHAVLINTIYDAVKNPECSPHTKRLGWALIAGIVLFSLYIAYWLLSMFIMLVVIIIGLYIGMSFFSFALEYERSHISLTYNPLNGKWMNGNTEYVVDETRGTARKKRLFEL